ncbi:MAG: dihydrodipicolinate synthase family protein [Saprospiraceae bacterium]|nr:dihydrodipicolinate synthase family protein [Saprospiraceae bacterium]
MGEWKWEGIFPALTTKFDASGNLDLEKYRINLDAQLEAGIHGIVLGGTLGEASTLTEDEKSRLVRFSKEYVNGKIPVILNIAEGSTEMAVRRAKEAYSLGADGLMLLPPMRYKPDERELSAYLTAVARATDLPVMIYNNPVDYGTEVSLKVFEKLATIDQIQAVKESTRDVTNVSRMLNAFGDRFRILCGVDTLAMEELVLGAHGWVAGLVCAFPKETVAVYSLIQQAKIEEARSIYRWFIPLLELDIHPKLVQYIKLAETMAGIGSEYVRPPRLALEGEELARITAIIQRGLDYRPVLTHLS